MSQKWNLQDIKPASPGRTRRKTKPPAGEEVESQRTKPEEFGDDKPISETVSHAATVERAKPGWPKKKRSGWRYLILLFILVLVGGLLLGYLKNAAELTVYPRWREPNVNATIEAYRSTRPSELSYEIMSLEAAGERQVPAAGEEEATEQATGTILIYNRQSTESVRLITNTRFETDSGLIFKISDPAVIPGYTRNAEGEIVPGVVSANVYADEAGERYNIGPSSFTIPGFTGMPEFDNVYAESLEPMRGGFAGQRFIIEEDELATAQEALRRELRESLLARVESERPAGFIVFPGAVTITYETLPATEAGEGMATLKETATLRVPIFAEENLARYIAASTIPGYDDAPMRLVDGRENLEFAYENETTSRTNISALESISFKLQGRPTLVWDYDQESLLNDLSGASKTALPAILGAYPAIERAEASFRPAWKSSFPDDPNKIKIAEVLESGS